MFTVAVKANSRSSFSLVICWVVINLIVYLLLCESSKTPSALSRLDPETNESWKNWRSRSIAEIFWFYIDKIENEYLVIKNREKLSHHQKHCDIQARWQRRWNCDLITWKWKFRLEIIRRIDWLNERDCLCFTWALEVYKKRHAVIRLELFVILEQRKSKNSQFSIDELSIDVLDEISTCTFVLSINKSSCNSFRPLTYADDIFHLKFF